MRSSATTEDLGGAAFAGQHGTYLNCSGFEDIALHLKRCWLSLWSSRALAYRRNAGFDLRDTSMAVVIQSMAFCDVAGVGFSIDPVSGNLGHQVFDANYGPGESVVGGETAIIISSSTRRAGRWWLRRSPKRTSRSSPRARVRARSACKARNAPRRASASRC